MEISKIARMQKMRVGNQNVHVDEQGILNPAVQIYIWLCLALAIQILNGELLVIVAGLTIVLAIRICAVRFLIMLRRTRWILFSILLIYAFASPGEALWSQLGAFSPVIDGVAEGLLQLLRLITVLAGLSILLTLLALTQLIAGIYTLLRPLTFLGFSRDRIAVRLALTLRYAERAISETASNWRESIEQLLAPVQAEQGEIELQVGHFIRLDWLLVVASSVALMGVWL